MLRRSHDQLAVVGPKIVTLMDEALTSISRRIGECAQEWTQSWVGFCEQVRLWFTGPVSEQGSEKELVWLGRGRITRPVGLGPSPRP